MGGGRPTAARRSAGLLKLPFDQIGAGQLRGTPTVPLMVGASCPTAGLYVLDSELDALDETIETWTASAAPLLAGAMIGAAMTRAVSP